MINISFELFCVEILNIPFYNFLSPEEWDIYKKKYEKYLENNIERENLW